MQSKPERRNLQCDFNDILLTNSATGIYGVILHYWAYATRLFVATKAVLQKRVNCHHNGKIHMRGFNMFDTFIHVRNQGHIRSLSSLALIVLMLISYSETAVAYTQEYVNCGSSSCPIPDLKVGGIQHGTVTGECTSIELPNISMKCEWQDGVYQNQQCTYDKVSTSEMTCSCENKDLGPVNLTGTVNCSN